MLFLSTPSARRATRPEWCEKILSGISIHALREEGDRSSSCTTHRPSDFYPRPPRGGRRYGYGKHKVWVIFLSTPSARRATTILARSMQRGEFLSTPSARRATVRSVLSQSSRMDFYPRPPRGGRLPEIINEEEQLDISIHALREEGDESPRNERHLTGDFYPRPPRGGRPYRWQGSHLYYHDFYPRPPRGGRPKKRSSALLFCRFLSTPSARRATSRWSPPGKAPAAFLSTPSARRATIRSRNGGVDRGISIHALREEGDRHCHVSQWREKNFYPRPPRGGRRLTSMVSGYVEPLISIHALREEGDRANSCTCLWQAGISIHALREEGDCPQRASPPQPFYFYPRPPRGGRRCSDMRTSGPAAYFYPRPPRGGRRGAHGARSGGSTYFYPRPPRGGRHYGASGCHRLLSISIHALREEGDLSGRFCPACCCISIHALREEGDIMAIWIWFGCPIFLSTPSARRATLWGLWMSSTTVYFYPRPPRGGRPLWPVLPGVLLYFYPRPPRGGRHNGHLDLVRLPDISIHALREEGDGRELGRVPNLNLFLSTPSARRATCGHLVTLLISLNFYPRPPRGGRPMRSRPTTP